MSDLYHLVIRRKKIRTLPDATLEETWVEESMRGVPAQLCNTWQQEFPNNYVSATKEEPGVERPARQKGFFQGRTPEQRTQDRERFLRAEKRPADDKPHRVVREEKSAMEMGYGDAISRALKESK